MDTTIKLINRECVPMNDKAENKADEIKGKVKKNVGKALGNERMEAEGKAKETKGDIKQAGDKVKDVFEE